MCANAAPEKSFQILRYLRSPQVFDDVLFTDLACLGLNAI
jgi:hypothetical protein